MKPLLYFRGGYVRWGVGRPVKCHELWVVTLNRIHLRHEKKTIKQHFLSERVFPVGVYDGIRISERISYLRETGGGPNLVDLLVPWSVFLQDIQHHIKCDFP